MNLTIKKITAAAVLLALSVVSTIVFKTIPMGPFTFLRISLSPALIMFSSIVLGPFFGAAVGVGSDLIPAIIFPTGAPNFFITIVYGILGVLPWILEKFTSKFRFIFKKPITFIIGLAAVFLGVAVMLFTTSFFQGTFGEGYMTAIWIALGILFVVSFVCGLSVFFMSETYDKNIEADKDVPTPAETSLIVLFCEFFVMCLGKSFAFYLFFLILGEGSGPTFETVFTMIFLGLGINVTIGSLSLYWMLQFENKFLHLRGAKEK